MTRSHAIAALLAPLLLAGCGLRPLYGGGGAGPAGRVLARVEVGEAPGRPGFLVRSALVDRLAAAGHETARYRLEFELDDRITGLGVRADNAVTRERRTLRARYRLVDAGDGAVLLDATAGSDVGIDVVSSEYATIAAEDSALDRLAGEVADQIVTRLALFGSRAAAAPAPAPIPPPPAPDR